LQTLWCALRSRADLLATVARRKTQVRGDVERRVSQTLDRRNRTGESPMGSQTFEDLDSLRAAIREKEVAFYGSCPAKLSSVRAALRLERHGNITLCWVDSQPGVNPGLLRPTFDVFRWDNIKYERIDIHVATLNPGERDPLLIKSESSSLENHEPQNFRLYFSHRLGTISGRRNHRRRLIARQQRKHHGRIL
jgi:hypothetical protein